MPSAAMNGTHARPRFQTRYRWVTGAPITSGPPRRTATASALAAITLGRDRSMPHRASCRGLRTRRRLPGAHLVAAPCISVELVLDPLDVRLGQHRADEVDFGRTGLAVTLGDRPDRAVLL